MEHIVVDLGFGDGGKGRTVDQICSVTEPETTLVIRYSGGGQAGHTVVLEDGTRHVFSNFGAGTLRGAATYWSKFCTFDPAALLTELKTLGDKAPRPSFYLDLKCPIVTPYDIQAQRINSENRANGTVGCGIGTTIQREEDHFHLLVEDLLHPKVLAIKLDLIRTAYYPDVALPEGQHNDFLKDCLDIFDRPDLMLREVDEIPEGFEHFIFESSQGILLDQDIGFFPHVTRSNTSTKNAMFQKWPKVWAVTRAYQTGS
jgi:adenylosuccinate synthase